MGERTPAPALEALQIDVDDDVAVATAPLGRAQRIPVGGQAIELVQDIPGGHKFAVRNIAQGDLVRKYGWTIGRATADITRGEWVHTHNLQTTLYGMVTADYRPVTADAAPAERCVADFMGYRRADGRVGTRNEVWVLPTVGCVARTAERIARVAAERHAGAVDGIHAFTHPLGCSQVGDDLGRTRSVLAALATHPNAGGVLLIGLGCESNDLHNLLVRVGHAAPDRVRTLTAQQCEDETEAGLAAVAELVAMARHDRREPCPTAGLTLGLKCGGSDGLSGITANPLVGRVTDRVTAAGGTAILTEIPEVFGAEQVLLGRAASRAAFDGMLAIINDFRCHFTGHGRPIHENPSPGNIAGGITTLEEKSLGAVQKGGRAPVTQALRYGEAAVRPGLALLEAPGNDAISSTALVAAGANILLFTTGRGTPLGFPVPTLKIASNSELARRKPAWIDFDAGCVLHGEDPERVADALLEAVLDTASGRPARNELNGERDIALWKGGVTL
jgi:altronate hydrolase